MRDSGENTPAQENASSEKVMEEKKDEEVREPVVYEGELELPVEGAAGYSSIELPLYASPSKEAEVQKRLAPGSAFEILSEEGAWWQIQTPDVAGWIEHKYAFINLPDVIPSIIYDNTNSYAALFTSSRQPIPSLTNEALYDAVDYNERLEKDTFIVPILYATAKKVHAAQQLALENGEALKIYEAYRPYDTQQKIVKSVARLAEQNEEVREGINRGPWSQGWFISTNDVSNHQIGAAMDVSLVQVDAMEETVVGDYVVQQVSEYTEHEMQTPMHELSADAVVFERPVSSDSRTAWREQTLVDEMTEAAKRLQHYATEAGFTPLASEWWHFNDLDALESLGDSSGRGAFTVNETLNSQPSIEK